MQVSDVGSKGCLVAASRCRVNPDVRAKAQSTTTDVHLANKARVSPAVRKGDRAVETRLSAKHPMPIQHL